MIIQINKLSVSQSHLNLSICFLGNIKVIFLAMSHHHYKRHRYNASVQSPRLKVCWCRWKFNFHEMTVSENEIIDGNTFSLRFAYCASHSCFSPRKSGVLITRYQFVLTLKCRDSLQIWMNPFEAPLKKGWVKTFFFIPSYNLYHLVLFHRRDLLGTSFH
jgi:hypothetical protein